MAVGTGWDTAVSHYGVSVLLSATKISGFLLQVPITGSGSHALQASYAPDQASNYAASSSNTVSVTGTAALQPASLSLTLNPGATGTYGTAFSVTASVAQAAGQLYATGEVTYQFDNDSAVPLGLSATGSTVIVLGVPGAGSHSVVVNYGGDANYAATQQVATFVVTKATPTVTWANPSDINYGTALSATQLNAAFTSVFGGGRVGVLGTSTYTPPIGTVLNAGPQTLSVSFAPTNTANYNTAGSTVTINVIPAVAHLVFSSAPPAWVVPGASAGTVAVAVEDDTGKVIASSAAAVTLNVTGPGSYSQTYTKNVTEGIATFDFSKVALTTTGGYTYTATSAGMLTANASEMVASATQVGSSSLQTLTLTITTPGTLGSISVVTQGTPMLDFQQASGGTCAVGQSYTVGATCTLNVTFAPLYAGLRMGAVTLVSTYTSAGRQPLASAYVSGIGAGGPQLFIDPTVSTTFFLGGLMRRRHRDFL